MTAWGSREACCPPLHPHSMELGGVDQLQVLAHQAPHDLLHPHHHQIHPHFSVLGSTMSIAPGEERVGHDAPSWRGWGLSAHGQECPRSPDSLQSCHGLKE